MKVARDREKKRKEKERKWLNSSVADFGFHIDCIIIKVVKELGDLAW